jgi:DNA polymerase-1
MPQVTWLVEQLHRWPEWSYDLETTGASFLHHDIICASFSWAQGMAACIVFGEFSADDQDAIWIRLREVFANKSKKVTQNGTFDVKFLWKKNVNLLHWSADTILEDHLLNENQLHGLEFLAKRYTTMGGYHDALDAFVASTPEADPSMCKVAGSDKWKKVKTAEKDEDIITEYGSYSKIPSDMLHEYACQDADATLRVHVAMVPLLREQNLMWVMTNIQMPTQEILSRVEYSGVTVDQKYNAQLKVEYAQKMKVAWENIRDVPEVRATEEVRKQDLIAEWGKKKKNKKSLTPMEYLEKNRDAWEFKLSTQRLEELIIGQFHQPPLKFGKVNKKTGQANVSMDKAVLAEYAKTLPIAQQIMDYRQLAYLNSNFIQGLSHFIHTDGRVRSNYPLFRTVTGRPSSFQPNLNNIPRKREEIKHQFVADPGDWLVEADLSQIEFRIWASYSQDPQMVADINNGLDIHKITAAMGKGLIIPMGVITYEQFKEWTKDITKEERNIAKTVVFGMMYGRGPKSIAAELGITLNQARKIIQLFFGRYPTAEIWLQQTVEQAKRTGVVINLYGRRRRLPILLAAEKQVTEMKRAYADQVVAIARGVPVPDEARIDEAAMKEEIKKLMWMRSKAERQAVNSPIQGGASDTNFLAAGRIDKEMRRMKLRSRMVLTVYDSLVYTVKPTELDAMLPLVHMEMLRKTEWLKVRLNCEIKVGRQWGNLEEVPFSEDHVPDYTNVKILKAA